MATMTLEQERDVAVPQYRDGRHPLSLPAGSVRATLCLITLGVLVFQLAQPGDRDVRVPLALYGLLAMTLLFIVSHGGSIAPAASNWPSPWWLPGGFVRGLMLLAIVGVLGWQLYVDPRVLLERLTPSAEQLTNWPYVLAATGGGFVLGRLAHASARRSAWMQDILAWVVLLAMVGLGVEWVLVGVINPSLHEGIDLRWLELALVGLVTFYFGARS